jgi:hypothetical protein
VQECSKHQLIRAPHDHLPTMYNLLSERYSYPNAPSMTIIPAFSLVVPEKAGIHHPEAIPQTTYQHFLLVPSTLYPFSDQARNVRISST